MQIKVKKHMQCSCNKGRQVNKSRAKHLSQKESSALPLVNSTGENSITSPVQDKVLEQYQRKFTSCCPIMRTGRKWKGGEKEREGKKKKKEKKKKKKVVPDGQRKPKGYMNV
jgi:hypothetical protein